MPRAESRAARVAGVRTRLELGDEIFEVVHLVRQINGMLPFGVERLFGGGLLFLPRVDQHVQAELLVREPVEILRQCRTLADDVLTHPRQLGEVAGDSIGFRAHVRHDRPERDRGA